MAESTAQVRRDIELTRERMSSTLQELEHRLNLLQVVRENPWPALALAFGAGLVLSRSGADVHAAEATTNAARGAGGRIAPMVDDLVSKLVTGVTAAFEGKVETMITEIQRSITGTAPTVARTAPAPEVPRAD